MNVQRMPDLCALRGFLRCQTAAYSRLKYPLKIQWDPKDKFTWLWSQILLCNCGHLEISFFEKCSQDVGCYFLLILRFLLTTSLSLLPSPKCEASRTHEINYTNYSRLIYCGEIPATFRVITISLPRLPETHKLKQAACCHELAHIHP